MNARCPVDVSQMVNGKDIAGENLEHVEELLALYEEARNHVTSQAWCQAVVDGWMDWGWGYILGIFFFHIAATPDTAEFVWVVVGDIPPAIIDARECPSRISAMREYVTRMREWVACVNNGDVPGATIIPVNVPPRKMWARRLGKRLDFIETKIWPYLVPYPRA